MRTTFNAIYREAAAGIETATERRTELQRQVATGKRISRPSDDPSGMSTAIGERAQIGTVEQFTRTATAAGSRLSVVDTILSDIVEQLSRASSAAVAARGSEQSAAQREAAALAIEAVHAALFDDLNASFRGAYLFGGARSDAPPFVKDTSGAVQLYAGSATEVSVDIDRNRTVTVSFDGGAIAQGGASQDIFAVLDELASAARAGDSAALGDGLDKIDVARQRVIGTQSRLGAEMNTIDDQKLRLVQMKLAATTRLDKVEAANLAEAISGMMQADAAYQAALGAIGSITRVSLMDYLR